MTTPVRIAHFSDTHLGYRGHSRLDPDSGRNQRSVDVDDAFTRAIDGILEAGVDGVIHSGDVFHHSRPTWHSLRHFIRQMRRLEQAKLPVLVIAGNHDTPRVRSGGSAYSVLELALPDTRFIAEYEDAIDADTFGAFDIQVHAVPHGALTNPDPVMPTIAQGRRNIMVVHGTVPGILPAGIQTEPGEQLLDGELLDSRFDYIALGHIHQYQQVRPNAWYTGSTERFGWGDITATPGYQIVELAEPGQPAGVTHVDIDARPMIALKPVNGGGKSARDIADMVLAQVEKLAQPSAMTRVELRDTPRPERREVQNLLRREVGDLAWSLDIAPERTAFITEQGTPVLDDSPFDLHALFNEFVAIRQPTYPNDAFTALLLERGSQALTDAMVAEENPVPEDDAVS